MACSAIAPIRWHVVLVLLVLQPVAVVAQNPPRLVGDWDYWQNRFVHRPGAYAHLPADSSGGWLRTRDGQTTKTIASSRVSGDSVFLEERGQPYVVAGVLRNDTITAAVQAGGRTVARVWMVRRSTPPRFDTDFPLWPGPVSDSAFAVAIDTAAPMRARDGTTLLSLVVRPVGEGPFPVILDRTPYGRQRLLTQSRFFASRGYITVVQDVRGRYGSEGTFRYISGEDTDGFDAVEWAAALPASNGKVGTLGGSYEGKVQWYAAVTHPPHLAAMVPLASPPDPWLDFPYRNMTFTLAAIANACMTAGRVNQDVSRLDAERGFRLLPVRRIPTALGCQPSEFWDAWMDHGTLDDYWRAASYQGRLADVHAPVLHISGWFDDDGNGATTNFNGLGRVPGHPAQRLVIGPWSHRLTPALLNGDFGAQEYVDVRLLALRWFDRWLKGVENGVDREPPITLFVMGDNVWRAENEWPLARTAWTRFYLHSQGRANTSAGDGVLDTIPPRTEPADTFSYDPDSPTPYIIDPREFEMNLDEEYSRLHAERRDVVVYTSAPLAKDVEVTGPLSVTVWAATDARDTDWHAMLLDVHPDGRAYRLQDGIVRARFREGYDREVFVVPGRPIRYTIDLWHTSTVFPAGHRIRVAIASAAFPKYGRNLNTGGDNNSDSTFVTAHQRILHDRAHSSYITLPVIPR
jgi:putative CocE/NonD family hydrolase